MEQPIMRLIKNVEKKQGKVVVPRAALNKWGTQFYMEIYKDHIKLIPVKKGE